MVSLSSKKERNERILNLSQMDAATCRELKGVTNEHGECLINEEEREDGTLHIKPMRYKSTLQRRME